MQNSFGRKMSMAALVGLLGGIGLMGSQVDIRERPGHGRKFESKNVPRETKSRPWVGGKLLNKCQRKSGKYGGKDREEKMFKAGLKRDRKRAARLTWANEMFFAKRMVYMLGGFMDIRVCDKLALKIGYTL